MTAITKTSAKSYFTTGSYPTQSQFGDMIDSYLGLAETSAQAIATINVTTKLSALAANITTVSATSVYATNLIATTVSATVGGMLTGSLPNPTLSLSPITNSLSSDVSLSNIATYFDGPSVAQGSTGTWFASGIVTLKDTSAGATFVAKLWDGTTVISSATVVSTAANNEVTATLSGYLATPAGNLRISVKDISSTSGKIIFNDSANSKDSTITAFRIA